jgi:type IV pilus assembly protein PilY1
MKISQRTTNDKAHATVKSWSLKLMSTIVLACMANSTGHTSDLEIYQAPEGGNVVITMMLDNSISMGYSNQSDSIKNDYNISSSTYKKDMTEVIYDDNGIPVGSPITYEVYYRNKDNKPYYDRISRLKMALIPMFANPKSGQGFGADIDINKYKIGMGSFEAGGNTSSKGRGKIDVQAQSLNLAHRTNLINKIKSYTANSYTPIANSYATAGAYMLGSSTDGIISDSDTYNVVGLSFYSPNGQSGQNGYYLYECNTNSTTKKTSATISYYACSNYTRRQNNDKIIDTSKITKGFSKKINMQFQDIDKDIDDVTKKIKKEDTSQIIYYLKRRSSAQTSISPIIPGQCNAQGIYFLTDGEPNQSQTADTLKLMNNSLGKTPAAISSPCKPNLSSSSARFGSNSGWECISEYAPLLNSSENLQEAAIKTATVGFGSVYEILNRPEIVGDSTF